MKKLTIFITTFEPKDFGSLLSINIFLQQNTRKLVLDVSN